MKRVALGSLLLAAVACGPKPGPDSAAVLPDVPFEQLDHDQKIQFMKQVVMPQMTQLFQAHDAEKFAEFSCKTCHGDDVDRGHYHMPADHLPKLNLGDLSSHKQSYVEFMTNEVKPTMARLLREPEASASKPQGFGCLHCHPKAVP